VSIDRSFAPDAASIRAARRFVLAAVDGATPELRDAISVMVSELAMNAVQYACTTFVVSVDLTGDSLRVAVTDAGGGSPEAQPLPPASTRAGGSVMSAAAAAQPAISAGTFLRGSSVPR